MAVTSVPQPLFCSAACSKGLICQAVSVRQNQQFLIQSLGVSNFFFGEPMVGWKGSQKRLVEEDDLRDLGCVCFGSK